MKRAYNFNAGPSALPLAVLERAQKELLNFQQTGMSVMELSHRSKEYDAVHGRAEMLLRKLMNIPDTHDVIFLQGGASLQFSMVPMNLLKEGEVGNYVLTDSWSDKAMKEAEKVGTTHVAASSKKEKYTYIPTNIELSERPAYLHITSNNTIAGTQWREFPNVSVDLIADMSSDILSRDIDVSRFALIYAGAQKNLGPSGVTVVIIRKDLLAKGDDHLPTMLNYRTYSESRSHMNVTFTLPNEELTKKFLAEAKEKGLIGLAGHRSVGGCRASIYNAVDMEACEALVQFMETFRKNIF